MSTDKMRRKFEAYWTSREMGENNTRMGDYCFENWCTWQAALSQSEPAHVSQEPTIYFDNNGQIVARVSIEQVECLLRDALSKIESARASQDTCGSCINFTGESCRTAFEGHERYSDSSACNEFDTGELAQVSDSDSEARKDWTGEDCAALKAECDRLRIVEFDGALNDAGWTFLEALPSYDTNTFNFAKNALKVAIEKWISVKEGASK